MIFVWILLPLRIAYCMGVSNKEIWNAAGNDTADSQWNKFKGSAADSCFAHFQELVSSL